MRCAPRSTAVAMPWVVATTAAAWDAVGLALLSTSVPCPKTADEQIPAQAASDGMDIEEDRNPPWHKRYQLTVPAY